MKRLLFLAFYIIVVQTTVVGQTSIGNGAPFSDLANMAAGCNSSCTAGDFTFNGVYLASDNVGSALPTSCTSGQTLQAYFCFQFTNTTGSARTGVYVESEVVLGGSVTYDIKFTSPVLAPSNSTFTACVDNVITYNCGDDLSLQNIWFAWDSAGDNLTETTQCMQWPGSKCTGQASQDVAEPTLDCSNTISCSIGGVVAGDCFNMNMGQATVTPLGGRAPYTYLWDSGENTATATMLGGTSTGTAHTVTVSDANGCTSTCSTTIFGELTCCTPEAECILMDLEIQGCNATSLPPILNASQFASAFNIIDDCGYTSSIAITMTKQDLSFLCGKDNGGVRAERSYVLEINSVAVAMCCQVIDVVDSTSPMINPPPSQVMFDCGAIVDLNTDIDTWVANQIASLEATALDDCASQIDVSSNWDSSAPALDCDGMGGETIIFTVSDHCGNATTASTTIIIQDNTPPTIGGCPNSTQVFECAEAQELLTTINTWVSDQNTAIEVASTDDCDQDLVVSNDWDMVLPMIDCDALLGKSITFTVTDDCGNTSTCAVSIIVDDTTSPQISVEDVTLSLDADGTLTIDETDIVTSQSDNCTSLIDLEFAIDQTSFDCDDIGVLGLELMVTDDCDNTSVNTLNITIEALQISAGIGTTIDYCNANPESVYDLSALLLGDPSSGGVWTALNSNAQTVDISDPSQVDLEGVEEGSYEFQYRVSSACGEVLDAVLIFDVVDCFDLALRKELTTTGRIDIGDVIEFTIEVFNQGAVDAYDIVVQDFITGSQLLFDPLLNTAALTGNDSDWMFASAPTTDIVCTIDNIAQGESKAIKVFLQVDPQATVVNMRNEAGVIFATNKPGGDVDIPDEDDIDVSSGGGIAIIEMDNDISDDSNGGTDNPMDLDDMDFAIVMNCVLGANAYSETVCSNDYSDEATFDLYSTSFVNAISPITSTTLTYHVNEVQAEAGLHPMDAIIKTSSTVIFARVSDGTCYEVVPVTLNVVEKPIITQQPISSVICEVPSNVTLSVESSTTGVDYVWEGSLDGVTFYPVPDNTLNLLSLPINADYVPQYYRVTLTTSTAVNGITCSTTSRVVSVTHTGPEESLICNDIIQASVDGYCNLELVADQVLEAMTLSNNQYSVDLEDEEGNSVSNQEVGDYLGDTLTYKVVNKCTGLYCWGQVVLEDKIEPQISSCEDVVVPCEMDYDPESLLANPLYTQFAYPSYEDNCEGTTLTYTDAPGGQMCEQGYSGIVTRTWVVSDASGNSSSCTQTIYIDRVEVTEIVWPGDYMPTYSQSSPCTIFDLVNIDPAISGMPSGYTCPNLQFTFTDLEFEVCGASTKVLRTWYALDWCTGEYLEYGQNLEVYDDQPPVSYCGNTCFTIYTDPYTCSADFEIPAPIQWHNAASAPTAGDNAYYYDCSDGSDFEIRVSYGVVADGVDYITPEDPCGEDFNDLPIVYTEVVPTADGRYLVSDLPVGLAWFRYEFVDACGNALSDATEWCTKDVIIKDGSKPEAICESFTKATLDASGHTVILAQSFDDGSFDRCSPSDSLTFEVKRLDGFCEGHNEDLEYGADVFFCCNDIGRDSIPVMFRVTDEAGLSDECVGYVCVTDPEPFTVSCDSGPFTFTCAEEISQFAYPAPSTNFLCSFPITTEISFDSTGISECGVGTATRTVTFKNSNTMAVVGSCIQNIIVGTDFTLNQSNITCPADMTIPSCTVEYTPEILNSFPTITSSPHCSQLAISYIDSEPFGENANPACYTVLRTWTIIDWCVYNPEIPSVGRLECIQALNFNSIDGPMFTAGCDDVSTIDSNQDCEHYVVLQAMATDGDGCTPDSDLIYWYDLDQNNDGTIDVSNATGNNASGTYPIGTHSITYYAEDGCGNVNSCSHTFTIENNSAPSAICRSEVVWSLGEDGATEVWASDFDLSSTGSCGSSLSYSFTEDGATQVLGFTCDDIANGMVDTIALQMYVFDGIGGVDYCDVLLILQDNHNVCGDFVAANGSGRIAGKVINESQIGVEDFEVRLKDMDEGDMSYVMTNADGEFAFSNPSLYEDYSLHPYNNENHKQGVSTLDIVLIQRHLLNIQSLDNPYKIIAADANRSFTLTAADLVDIRKLILEVFDEFPSSESWQFVSNETSFIDVNHPWDYQNEIEITNHLLDVNDAEFVAIKVGDVNSSVWSSVNSEEVEQRSDESLNLYANIQSLEEGEASSIAIVNANDVMLYGLQYTLSFDPAKVAVESITSGILDVRDEHVNYSQAGEGIITLSVDMPLGLSIAADEELFGIKMLAIEEVELAKAIDITSEATRAEAVIDGVTPANVSLSFIDASSDVSDLGSSLVVFQNKPNPFSANTRIDYSISEVSDNVELTVFDANGRVIYFESQVPEIGKNTFYLHKDNLSNGGVLYYKVEANNTSVIKRMVIIE